MSKQLLRDARLRGNFNKWLNKQRVSRWNQIGQDPHRGGQYMNAAMGHVNQSKRPQQIGGQAYQNYFRNKSNEQPGLPTPTPPASAAPPVGPRRY